MSSASTLALSVQVTSRSNKLKLLLPSSSWVDFAAEMDDLSKWSVVVNECMTGEYSLEQMTQRLRVLDKSISIGKACCTWADCSVDALNEILSTIKTKASGVFRARLEEFRVSCESHGVTSKNVATLKRTAESHAKFGDLLFLSNFVRL